MVEHTRVGETDVQAAGSENAGSQETGSQDTDWRAGRSPIPDWARPWLRGVGVVGAGVGVAMLTAGGWVTAYAMTVGTHNESQNFYGTRGETRFADVRIPVSVVILAASVIVVALTAALLLTRSSAHARRLQVWISFTAWSAGVALIGVACFTRLLWDRTDDWGVPGTGYPAVVLAWWMTLGGLAAVGVSGWCVRPGNGLREVLTVPMAAVLAFAVGAVMIGVPPVERGDFTIETFAVADPGPREFGSVKLPGNLVPGLTSDVDPAGLGILKTNMPDADFTTLPASEGDAVRHDGEFTFRNLDGSLRWRLVVRADTYSLAAAAMYSAEQVVLFRSAKPVEGLTTTAIDARFGKVLWSRHGRVGYLGDHRPYYGVRSLVRSHLLDIADDARGLTRTSLRTGEVMWSHREPTGCFISAVDDEPSAVVVRVECAGESTSIVELDAESGAVTARQSADDDDRTTAVPRSTYEVRPVERGDEVVDSRSGRILLRARSVRCNTKDDCLFMDKRSAVVLRSLTNRYRDIRFPEAADIGRPLVLKDQVIWSGAAAVYVGDRSTRRVRVIDGEFSDPQLVEGGVFLAPSGLDPTRNQVGTGLFLRGVR